MKEKSTEAVIITVGTKKQKMLCKKLISEIRERYGLDIFVVSDEDFGCRIGSGGALINVIGEHYSSDKKMLIINSGGMSKRSINYAVRGKLFANLMLDGEVVSLLELLVINGRRLMSFIESGVVVCCSDILVDTKNLKGDFSNNVGVAIRTGFEKGSRHGVMYRDEKNLLDLYPHKISAEKLRALSEEYNEDGVLVDTGVIYFNDEICKVLKRCANEKNIVESLVENKIDLNLYPEIIALLASKVDKAEYINAFLQNEMHKEIRHILFEALSCFTLEVVVLEDQDFIHLGTLKESLDNIIKLSGEKSEFINLNSYIDSSCVVGKNTVLDNVILKNCVVGINCIVSDISLENITETEDNLAVCGVKLCDGSFVAIVCDVEENPKEKIGENELWDIPRFYKGKSYTESYNKFKSKASEEKFSLAYCTENADTEYYFTRCQYIKDRASYAFNSDYIKRREEIINRFFEKKESVKSISCKKDKAEVLLPVRVNLSGTWTDAMPYCIDNGGQVINMAVTVDGEKPIKVTAEKLEEKRIEFCSDGANEVFLFVNSETVEDLSDFNLHKAVLETVGITSGTELGNGFRLTTQVNSIDKGSGLGTSSILLGGCFKALGELFGFQYTDDEIFEMVFVAEQIMKTGGGWQDQVGGLTPGLKIITTEQGIEQKIDVREIKLPESFKKIIKEKMVLVPTGQRHFGRFIVNDVVNRYLAKNEESVSGHKEIKELNEAVLKSIEEENFEEFLECINSHFEVLKKISPSVSNEKIERLAASLHESLVDAVSICGAGGGGYLLAVMKDGITMDMLQLFMRNNFSLVNGMVKKIDLVY